MLYVCAQSESVKNDVINGKHDFSCFLEASKWKLYY